MAKAYGRCSPWHGWRPRRAVSPAPEPGKPSPNYDFFRQVLVTQSLLTPDPMHDSLEMLTYGKGGHRAFKGVQHWAAVCAIAHAAPCRYDELSSACGAYSLKLKERSGNVTENKGPLWKKWQRSGNVVEKTGSYTF